MIMEVASVRSGSDFFCRFEDCSKDRLNSIAPFVSFLGATSSILMEVFCSDTLAFASVIAITIKKITIGINQKISRSPDSDDLLSIETSLLELCIFLLDFLFMNFKSPPMPLVLRSF